MSELDEVMIEANFGPKKESSIIKVIGVGGAGNNAVQHMFNDGIIGVDFLICNTDRQAIENNKVPNKLVLGDTGLGAGADPVKAEKLATDCEKSIREFIGEETKMLFITAGMGKGTGTGASPVIARIAREMGVLTIAVVTYPYQLEGPKSAVKADKGIAELKKHVDSIIVIQNQKIMEAFVSETIRTALGRADDVLKNAVKCIAELITVQGYQNVDFNDVLAVMKDSGEAMIGLAEANGENRIQKVVSDAMTCPLINDANINNAKKFLFFVRYGEGKELTIGELNALSSEFYSYLGPDTEVIWGHAADKDLDDKIKLSVIITHYSQDEITTPLDLNPENKKPLPDEIVPKIAPQTTPDSSQMDETSTPSDELFSAQPTQPSEPLTHSDDLFSSQPAQQSPSNSNTFEFPGTPSDFENTPTQNLQPNGIQENKSNPDNADPFGFLSKDSLTSNTRPIDPTNLNSPQRFNPSGSQIQINNADDSNIYENDNAFSEHVNTPAYLRQQQSQQNSLAQPIQQNRMNQIVQPANPLPQPNYASSLFFGVIPNVD